MPPPSRWKSAAPLAALVLAGLAVSACGGASATAIPKTSDVRAALGKHGIDLESSPADRQGCVVMRSRASNSGAVRTFGAFTLAVARRDSCNEAQMTGSADGGHVYWAHTPGGWIAHEKLLDNLWLRMSTPSRELGDKQHALETAAFHAFDSGN
jgi:hypothetical protein